MSDGGMVVWFDAAADDDVNQRLSREHHPERITVPGVLRARRCVAVDGVSAHVVRRDARCPAVPAAAAFAGRLNDPTPRRRRGEARG